MEVDAVGSRAGAARPAQTLDTEAIVDGWSLELLARVLSRLLFQELGPGDACARAVGLGLIRPPAMPWKPELSARAASRLFLSGYQLPAQVTTGSAELLRDHLEQGRLVFVTLAGMDCDVFQVESSAANALGESWLTLTGLGAGEPCHLHLTWPHFSECWTAAGKPMIVAAACWSHLPTCGRTFFGGLRDGDGVYYWDTAACETNGQGEILRF